jgi:two-component system sensor histidine kinase DegS
MVLNLLAAPEDFTAAGDGHDAKTMLAAFHLTEQETAAFARELHDGPTQIFSATGLILEVAKEYLDRSEHVLAREELVRAIEQNRSGLDEIRALLFSLNPTGIQDGFETPLKRLAALARQMWGCKLSFTLSGDLERVSVSIRTGAFKTLHQAVLNAASHGASEVKVAVDYSKGVLRVRVTDNGKGFEVEREKNAAKERGSYGLINMEDRIKMLGGKFAISSVVQKGSSVSFSIPVLKFEHKDENSASR